jgi:hypothetical protein
MRRDRIALAISGIDAQADARKRIMIVPKVPVLDIVTETQNDNWVRVTGIRVKDTDGFEKVVPLAPPSNGSQSAVLVALGTIESTRLAINTFKDSLSGRATQRMGKNLIAHLRSNLTIRVPVTSLTSLPPSAQSSLQASALFVKGKANIAGEDRFFHLQITASGLNKLGQDSEAEQDDDRPFQALCLLAGEELDGIRLRGHFIGRLIQFANLQSQPITDGRAVRGDLPI